MEEMPQGIHLLWPTPIGVFRYNQADAINPLLVEEFASIRADQERQRGVQPAPFFASDDDLLNRVKADGWGDLVQFIVGGIAHVVERANLDHWAGAVDEISVGLAGVWFQIASAGTAHDVHTHGNCSWSGVYIVQIDPPAERVAHPVYGESNGATRLYGPGMTTIGGAFMDVSTAYLQSPILDVPQVSGQLLVFPSWLLHQAMAYAGRRDRIIISFNASVHGSSGDQIFEYSAR